MRVASRRNPNIAAVALANKNARVVWAMLAHGRDYQVGYRSGANGIVAASVRYILPIDIDGQTLDSTRTTDCTGIFQVLASQVRPGLIEPKVVQGFKESAE